MTDDFKVTLEEMLKTNDPAIMVRECDCDQKCNTMVVAMIRPMMVPEYGVVTFCANLPLAAVQGVVDEMRRICAKQGVVIR